MKKKKRKRGSSVSIAICWIADLRNNNDPSVGGGRGVGSGAMTGKRETNLDPDEAAGPRVRRGEIRLEGLGVQERLLPTLNAVLMPSTTGLPPQLQRRTCSRNRFSRPSLRRLSHRPPVSLQKSRPLSFSERCFRRFSFAPQSQFLSSIVL